MVCVVLVSCDCHVTPLEGLGGGGGWWGTDHGATAHPKRGQPHRCDHHGDRLLPQTEVSTCVLVRFLSLKVIKGMPSISHTRTHTLTHTHRKAQPAVNTDELAPLFVAKFNENAFCTGQLVTIEFGSQLYKAKVLHMTGVCVCVCVCVCVHCFHPYPLFYHS